MSEGINIARVAIPELHVLNEHPANLEKYSYFFSPKKNIAFAFLRLKILSFLRLAKAITNPPLQARSTKMYKNSDVLIISHLLNDRQLDLNEDFYFGTIPQDLIKENLSCFVALINHTGKESDNFSHKLHNRTVPTMIFRKSLPWDLEWNSRRLLKKERVRLKKLATSNENPIRSAALFVAKQSTTNQAIINVGLFYQIRYLVQELRPKTILITYEGHGWERLAFAAAREIIPNICCIGYQHAILYPRQHAITRSITPLYDANVILTAGSITNEILKKKFISNKSIDIKILGTHRYLELGQDLIDQKIKVKANRCLVIPDGTLTECIKIFDFVFEVALLIPDIIFIIRTHPVINYESLAKRIKRFRKLPANIQISNSTIQNDFKLCRWAIYRGSSSAIYAVVAGLRPFYFAEKNELSIDPLFSLKNWRIIVNTPRMIIDFIEDDLGSKAKYLEFDWLIARDFCLKYFNKLSFSVLTSTIKNHEK